jgi:hypothetical protein
MASKTQTGYLVLADISGYTSFLASTELEHAHEVMTDLLELIVNKFKPVLILSKLEGDAVFAYTPESKVPRGETLLEIIESTYVAFKDRVEVIHKRTTCMCNACRAIPTLDLKFISHYGSYIIQTVAGGSELVGPDVILIHRLLKNHVSETSGWRAYALFTEQTLKKINVWPESMHQQIENYEHVGDIQTHSINMHTRYKELVDARRVFISKEEADATISYDFSFPQPIIWEWLNDPFKRSLWNVGTNWSTVLKPGGRTQSGAVNHCAHGKSVTVENILDWRPFDYFTVEYPGFKTRVTEQLIPTSNGTRLTANMQINISLPKFLKRIVGNVFVKKLFEFEKTWVNIERLIAEEMQKQQEIEQQAD